MNFCKQEKDETVNKSYQTNVFRRDKYLSGGVDLEDEGGAVVAAGNQGRGADPNAGQKWQVAGLQLEDGHSSEIGLRIKLSFRIMEITQ